MLRKIDGLEFGYEPGVCCPVCNERLQWHNLQPCVTPNWMECEECQLLFNIESEEVFWYGDVTDEQFEAVRQYWLQNSELVVVQ